VFSREAVKVPPSPGVLRELDYEQPTAPNPHDAMVSVTLRKWLPRLLPLPPPPPAPAAPAGPQATPTPTAAAP
jgi:hypothetical protein